MILCADGLSPTEIAERLQLSVNTIKTHLRRVYDKCGVRRQAALVRLVEHKDGDVFDDLGDQ